MEEAEQNDNELRLISRYRKDGDPSAVGELYRPYMGLIYGLCLNYLKYREDSRDAVMQIFEKLLVELPRHEIVTFRSWLYVLARNFCLMRIRAGKGRHFEELGAANMELQLSWHPDDGDDESEWNLNQLERCMQELVTEQKQCVQLFYLEKKCYREISELTGFDGKKVKSYIQNGKRNLKICIERSNV